MILRHHFLPGLYKWIDQFDAAILKVLGEWKWGQTRYLSYDGFIFILGKHAWRDFPVT